MSSNLDARAASATSPESKIGTKTMYISLTIRARGGKSSEEGEMNAHVNNYAPIYAPICAPIVLQ